jgi:hypothetical protein
MSTRLAKILVGQFRKKRQTHPKCSGALLTNTKNLNLMPNRALLFKICKYTLLQFIQGAYVLWRKDPRVVVIDAKIQKFQYRSGYM